MDAIASRAVRASSGRLLDHAQGAARLDHHHAHVVRDHVVELAGDPLALLADGALGPLVALPLEPLRPLLERARVQAADPRRVAEQPRDDEDQLGLDERCRATSAMPARPTKTIGERGGGERGRRQRRPAVEALADGVDRDEDAEAGLGRCRPRQERELDDRRARRSTAMTASGNRRRTISGRLSSTSRAT